MMIIELLEKKRELLRSMESVTLGMRKKLEIGDIEEFLNLIGARQSVIEEIDGIDVLMESISAIAAEDNSIIDDLKHKNIAILHNIIEINSKLEPIAMEQVNNIKQKLKNLANFKNVFNLYGNRPYQLSGFFVEKKK
ncbi:MAG: hypothetical protein VR69_11695 [Peptococcaceae bacterium BRH_c4b]|nr:MAG: hypothetical protein VR69_11695 [Peptococcaceae bacterium BRH_c4b]